MKTLAKKISTKEDYDKLAKAINNYAAHCLSEKKEPRFVKMFSTFCNSDFSEWLEVRNPFEEKQKESQEALEKAKAAYGF